MVHGRGRVRLVGPERRHVDLSPRGDGPRAPGGRRRQPREPVVGPGRSAGVAGEGSRALIFRIRAGRRRYGSRRLGCHGKEGSRGGGTTRKLAPEREKAFWSPSAPFATIAAAGRLSRAARRAGFPGAVTNAGCD